MAVDELVEEITGMLGEEIHLSDWLDVDQKMIDGFANVTKDHQWIHVNVERAAKESPFGGTVAHGFLTLSLIPHLSGNVDASQPPYPGLKLSVNYGLNRVRCPTRLTVPPTVPWMKTWMRKRGDRGMPGLRVLKSHVTHQAVLLAGGI